MIPRVGRFLMSALLLLGPGAALAAEGEGTAGRILARMPVGARSLGLGGAHGTLPASAEVLLVNPAGLARVDALTAEAAYHRGVEDVTHSALLMAVPVSSWLAFGAGIGTLSAGNIQVYDYAGNMQEAALQEDRMYTAAATGRWGPALVGVSMKYVSSVLVGIAKSNSVLADVGLGLKLNLGGDREPWMGESPEWLYLGLAMSNIGDSSQYGFDSLDSDPAPTIYRFGLSMSRTLRGPRRILTALALDLPRSTAKPGFHGGAEVNWPAGFVEVVTRAGVRLLRDNGTFTAGLGMQLRGIRLDYAYLAATGPFGPTHHFSVELSLGGFRK